ncbi:MAG: PAS domain-containing sensor histidine kinase, partial [Verrucomicrobia bacterium]
ASGATVNRGEGETTRRFADSPSRPLPVSPPRRLAASPSTLHSPLPGLRATKHAPDELGELVDGFNEMLAQIETRDAALLRAHNELEGRVAERTQALFISNARLKEEVDGHERARQESDALREKLQRAYEHLQLEAERRSAVQEALRRSEERFSKAFRASPVPLAILTRTTRMIVDVNDRFAELAGRPREAIIGQAMFSVPVWAEAETRARLEQSLSDGEPLRNWEGRILGPEAEMSRANAERLKAANSNAEKLKTEKLKSDFSISAFQDFSVSQKSVSREAARAALLSTEHFQLGSEPCVLVMTEDISERVNLEGQLRQAQKMEAIGQLASGVAHDFNNLLTIIQGYTQLVLASLPGEVEGARVDSGKLIVDNHTPPSSIHCPASTMRLAREALEKVTNATQRATQLTGQLLTFSRKQMLQPRPLDLNQVVANVTGMLKPLLGENVRLQYQSAAALPPVQGDAGMMEQVIVNLAVNARDAMPKGGDLIISTFTCELDASYRQYQPQATAGRFVCLQVSDTGLGMDATTLERIFEPFFTTKGVGKGTGLGLATAYGIVKQHRGWIEVASQVGVGTTFKIFLPSTTAPTEVENASPLHSVRGGDELIMVVEDEPALRELFISVLRNFGYQVIEASHGREALGVWHSAARKPAMLLTDMMMPEGMTGWELAEKLRAEEPGLKVVYTSGYSPELFGGKVKLHGRSNFLPKPFHPRTLAQTVRQCLDN